MSKLSLPGCTLFCADCVDIGRAEAAVDICLERCDFGAVKLLSSIPSKHPHAIPIPCLDSHLAYSAFMAKCAVDFIDTSHVLVVQHDGWILNPDAWEKAWESLDYVGPLFIHPHSISDDSVGSGGFSYRSKAIMKALADLMPPFYLPSDVYHADNMPCYEDGMLALHFRGYFESRGFKYADYASACRFAFGGQSAEGCIVERPFGFHGHWSTIDHNRRIITGAPPESPSYTA